SSRFSSPSYPLNSRGRSDELIHCGVNIIIPAGPLGLARTGYIKRANRMRPSEMKNDFPRFFGRDDLGINCNPRSFLLTATLQSVFRSSANCAVVENYAGVGINHIAQSTFGEPANCQLANRITVRNSAEFVQSPGRTPAATCPAMLQGDIECGAVYAGL